MAWVRIEENSTKKSKVPNDRPVVYFYQTGMVLTERAYKMLNHPAYIELLRDPTAENLIGISPASAASPFSRRVTNTGSRYQVSMKAFVRDNKLYNLDVFYELGKIDGVICFNISNPCHVNDLNKPRRLSL